MLLVSVNLARFKSNVQIEGYSKKARWMCWRIFTCRARRNSKGRLSSFACIKDSGSVIFSNFLFKLVKTLFSRAREDDILIRENWIKSADEQNFSKGSESRQNLLHCVLCEFALKNAELDCKGSRDEEIFLFHLKMEHDLER